MYALSVVMTALGGTAAALARPGKTAGKIEDAKPALAAFSRPRRVRRVVVPIVLAPQL
ncbi:MAG TPA: hypothetical protein VL912_04250 [Candidatus Udaeobacter sp.]|nr:hypothetical protein [Candidatus Udaeobacter sp.]